MAVAVFISWATMAFSMKNGVLSAPGMGSLKYFTVLSNLLQGVASVAYVLSVGYALAKKGAHVPRGIVRLKYAASVSVSLTFLTVVLFLGPVFGFWGMFDGPSFWFHLIVPLTAALDFCALDREGCVSFRDSFIAIAPMLIYGAFYALNIIVNGLGEPGHSNDWYGFAAGGIKTYPFVFSGMALATWGVALLERLPRRGGR